MTKIRCLKKGFRTIGYGGLVLICAQSEQELYSLIPRVIHDESKRKDEFDPDGFSVLLIRKGYLTKEPFNCLEGTPTAIFNLDPSNFSMKHLLAALKWGSSLIYFDAHTYSDRELKMIVRSANAGCLVILGMICQSPVDALQSIATKLDDRTDLLFELLHVIFTDPKDAHELIHLFEVYKSELSLALQD